MPPVAVADSPDLVARVAALEDRTAATEENAAAFQRQAGGKIDALEVGVLDLKAREQEFVFYGAHLQAVFMKSCPGGSGWYRETAQIREDQPLSTLGGAEIREGQIEFEMNREADVLFEVSFNTGSQVEFMLDEEYPVQYSISGTRSNGLVVGEGHAECSAPH